MPIPDVVREKTCCFSGYRPHKFRFKLEKDNSEYIQLENDITNAILDCYREGCDTFLCGGAMGFDLICGELVILLKKRYPGLRLVCVIPCGDQAHSFTSSWRERYNNVLKSCDFVYLISEKYVRGCYRIRNTEMIENSSRVITYFDGLAGGTAGTLAMAQKAKLQIINTCNTENEISEDLTFYTGRN